MKNLTPDERELIENLEILAVDLRGSLGTIVASRNHYGAYFRRRVVPRDPHSTGQLAQRSSFATVAKFWGTGLTRGARASWDNAHIKKTSKFGDRVTLTGQAAWMFFNLLRHRIGLPLILLPPRSKDAVTFTMPAVRLTAPNTLTLAFGPDTWNAPGGGILLSGSPRINPGAEFCPVFNTIGSLVHPGTGEWSAEYPSPVAEGDRVRLRFHASAPSGRQCMVVLQDVVAEAAIYDL